MGSGLPALQWFGVCPLKDPAPFNGSLTNILDKHLADNGRLHFVRQAEPEIGDPAFWLGLRDRWKSR